MGMNRAISLGFLLLLTVSFVSDGVGTGEPINPLEEYLTTLPDHFRVLGSEASYSYTDKVGTEYNFIILSRPSTSWFVVSSPTTHRASGIELLRSFGRTDVDNVVSFNITSTKSGTETIQLRQRNSYGSVLQSKYLTISAVFNAAQATEDVKRQRTLRDLPRDNHHLVLSNNVVGNLVVGTAVYFLVDNRETTDEGTATGLTWTTDGSSADLRISEHTTRWDTAVNGMPKLYSFKVIPTQPGTFTFEAKQMQGSQTIATKTVTLHIRLRRTFFVCSKTPVNVVVDLRHTIMTFYADYTPGVDSWHDAGGHTGDLIVGDMIESNTFEKVRNHQLSQQSFIVYNRNVNGMNTQLVLVRKRDSDQEILETRTITVVET